MKCLLAAIILMTGLYLTVNGQSDLQKLVDTEHAFAAAAAAKDTRSAFLEYMADGAVVFTPDVTAARPYWSDRKPTAPSLLSWAPNFADVSSNGVMGYTTGNWEYRAKGKDDEPSAFGDFITVWMRQPSGIYRWVLDVGVGHAKPASYSTEWASPASSAGKDLPHGEPLSDFYDAVKRNGLKKAYDKFASPDIRSYREDMLPIIGKKESLAVLAKDKGNYTFGNRSTSLTAADLSYHLNTYTRLSDGKEEKGNYLQIWKYIDGRWQMVLDIFKPGK
jgi:hypothetical protein